MAGCLQDGTFVNVGIGIPGLVPHYVPDERAITFHAEHGVIGFGSDRFGPDGPIAPDGRTSPDLKFFSSSYRLRPGAFLCDHTRSFALIRSGRIDVTVLGAFEVEASGRFANWQAEGMSSGCPGGSPELAGGAKRVIVAMEHCAPGGRPRLVERTELTVGLARPAHLVVTELGVFEPAGQGPDAGAAAGSGFRALRLADGVDLASVQAVTGAEVVAG